MDIISGSISSDEVARYYVQCELEGILQDAVKLSDVELPRLLEALSFTYRANSVFDYIGSEKYLWKKVRVSVDDVVLTGMGDELTPVIYSNSVRQNPKMFAQYIRGRLSDNDPMLEQMRPRPVSDNRAIILLRDEGDDQLKMLDGSHRLMSLFMNGVDSVEAYVAVLSNPDGKSMIGDSIFLRLRYEWQATKDMSYREAIETTIVGLIRSSLNGEKAVQSYWVSMAPTQEVKDTGKKLIEKSGGQAA